MSFVRFKKKQKKKNNLHSLLEPNKTEEKTSTPTQEHPRIWRKNEEKKRERKTLRFVTGEDEVSLRGSRGAVEALVVDPREAQEEEKGPEQEQVQSSSQQEHLAQEEVQHKQQRKHCHCERKTHCPRQHSKHGEALCARGKKGMDSRVVVSARGRGRDTHRALSFLPPGMELFHRHVFFRVFSGKEPVHFSMSKVARPSQRAVSQ